MLCAAKGTFATAVVVTATVAALTVGGAGAATPPTLTGPAVLCDNMTRLVTGSDGKPYEMRTPHWRGGPGKTCVATSGHASFRITRTPATDNHVNSFPDIAVGCAQWACTPDMRLPRRLSAIGSLKSSMVVHTAGVRGTWNASYDMWLGKTKFNADGSSTRSGAEVMVWPNYSVNYAGNPIVHIDRRDWYFMHWHTCDHTRDDHHRGGVPEADVTCFRYISFRAVHRYNRVHELRLGVFFRWLEDRQMVRKWWWLESVEAGFEVWSGGQGLGITQFSVDIHGSVHTPGPVRHRHHRHHYYSHRHDRQLPRHRPQRHKRHLRRPR